MANSEITLHWFLPTYGDSRAIMAGGHGTTGHYGEREADLCYLTQLALAAESNGFDSVLVPTGLWCEDAWIATAALIGATKRLSFLVAARPSLVSPTVIAQQATTFQKLSNGRLKLNVVIGGEDHEQRAFGDHRSKEERYAVGDESLQVINHLLTEDEPITLHGEHVDVENAVLSRRPAQPPQVFFGGSSPAGIEVAAKHAQVYLTWGERPADVQAKIKRARSAAARHGRELDYGIRLHIIARETEEEAWAEAQRLVDGLDPEVVGQIQGGLARSQSEGQRRMTALHSRGGGFTHGTDARELEVAPNLWAGIGLVRGGAGTALVGSYAQVAERIGEYFDAGLSHFIFSGYPHLEEAFHVGEGVIPELHRLGYGVKNRPAPEGERRAAQVPFAPVAASAS